MEQNKDYDEYANTYDERYDTEMCHQEDMSIKTSLELVPNIDSSRIIDLGCGTGFIIDLLGGKVNKHLYVGLDVSEEMLKKARIKYPNYVFINKPAELLKDVVQLVNDQSLITSIFTVPYIGEKSFEEAYDVLNYGDYLYIVYYDKPYLNSSSVYFGDEDNYNENVLPRVRRCIKIAKNKFSEEYDCDLTGHGAYRMTLLKKREKPFFKK